MKGINRYIIRLPRDFDMKAYSEKIGENVIYQAAQYGADNEHLINHAQLEAVPPTEKFLVKGDVVYMSWLFFSNMHQLKIDDKFFAAMTEPVWTGHAMLPEKNRINFPLALFVLRGKNPVALYENNVCDVVWKTKDVYSTNRKRYAQRAKVISSRHNKEGETILYTKNADYEVNLNGVQLLTIPERWVVGKVSKKGNITLKDGWNIIKALDEGGEWKRNRHGLYVKLKDMADRGVGEVVQGPLKGKTVLFKKRSPLEETEKDKHLYLCDDKHIYATLGKYEGV